VKIDHEIMARFLTNFRSEAQADTGLGLFYLNALLSELREDLS
jgi:hypothetical protein